MTELIKSVSTKSAAQIKLDELLIASNSVITEVDVDPDEVYPDGSCVSISDELLRSVLESVSTIAISGSFHLDPHRGLTCLTTDQYRDFVVECQLAPNAFDFYNVNRPHIEPMYFDTLLRFVASKIPKGYSILWWLEARCWQGYSHKQKTMTKIFHLRSEDLKDAPFDNPFQPTTIDLFSHVAQITRSEFNRILEFGLFDPVMIHVGICQGKLFFYAENDGRGQVLLPSKNVEPSDYVEMSRHGILRPQFASSTTPSRLTPGKLGPGCAVYDTKERGQALVQIHSLRYLVFICRSRQVADTVTILLSSTDGMVVSFAIKHYGLIDLDRNGVLDDRSYIRFHLSTSRKREIQPILSMLRTRLEIPSAAN